jgi:hypothetical protein
MVERDSSTYGTEIGEGMSKKIIDAVCNGLEKILGAHGAAEVIDSIRNDPKLSTPEAAVNFAYGVVLSNGYKPEDFIDATGLLLEPDDE